MAKHLIFSDGAAVQNWEITEESAKVIKDFEVHPDKAQREGRYPEYGYWIIADIPGQGPSDVFLKNFDKVIWWTIRDDDETETLQAY